MKYLKNILNYVLDSDEIEPDEQVVLDQLIMDEILISDILYVYNKDKSIGKTIQTYIDYAKDHNKWGLQHFCIYSAGSFGCCVCNYIKHDDIKGKRPFDRFFDCLSGITNH